MYCGKNILKLKTNIAFFIISDLMANSIRWVHHAIRNNLDPLFNHLKFVPLAVITQVIVKRYQPMSQTKENNYTSKKIQQILVVCRINLCENH